MMITKDQVNYLDNVAGRADKEAFMQSETAQMYKDMGADLEAVYELDLPPPEEDGLGEEVMEIDLVNPEHEQGKVFNFASQTLHDHHWGVGQYKQEGDASLERMRSTNPRAYASRMQSRQRAESRSPQEISEFGVEYGGNLNWNLGSGLINWAKIDDLPPDVAIAQAGLLEMYERLPNWTWSGTGRMLKGFATDPFTYAGGLGGFKVVQQLIRGGGIAAARSRLMQSAAKALGYTIIGSEGLAYGVLDDLMKQRLKHNPEDGEFVPNYNQAMIAGGFGAAFTAGGTAAIQAAPGMYRAGRDAFNRMAGDGTTLRSGIGPLDTRPEAQMAAQPDAMGFRSGLINMLDALPESASGEQMLATLSDPQRLGEYGAKAEEISLTGLDKFLREAEGPVTKSDIAAHLEANRVELDEARDTGAEGGGYMAGEMDSITYTPADDMESLVRDNESPAFHFDSLVVSGYRADDDFGGDTVDVFVNERFPIEDGRMVQSLIDDIRITVDSERDLMVFPGDDDFSAEVAKRLTGEEGANYVRPEIAEGIEALEAQLEKLRRFDINGKPSDDFDSPSSADERNYSNILIDLDEATNGIAFQAMERRKVYDLFDNQDGYRVGSTYDENEAQHIATQYIDGLDAPEGDGAGRWSSITFPTNDGGKPENYKEVRLLMPENDKRFPYVGDVSQHFEQNTFAHYRSTDRQVVLDNPDQPDMFGGADPKDVMFVEEIQSDLMQAGGRRGYQTEEVMDTWKAEGTEIHERMKDKLAAFGYGEDLKQQTKDADILTNLTGLYEGFSRMMKGKDRVEAMEKYLAKKLGVELSLKVFPNSAESQATNAIVQTIAELPKKKMSDEQLYDAFNMFVATLASFRGGGNEVGGAVRDLSPKRYGSKMVDSDGYDRGLEFLDKLTSKDLRDFYQSRDKAIIAQSGVPDIPLKKDWVELTMKRAIYDALEEGKTMIAFPNHAETVGAIEYDGRPATGAIARLYEKEIPKILQKLAKQTGGEIRTGSIAESIKHRADDRFMRGEDTLDDALYQDQGSVIILDLSGFSKKDNDFVSQKVRRQGFAIPAIAGGATALTAAQQMQQQEQPQQ
jgi:hypothetical protein